VGQFGMPIWGHFLIADHPGAGSSVTARAFVATYLGETSYKPTYGEPRGTCQVTA